LLLLIAIQNPTRADKVTRYAPLIHFHLSYEPYGPFADDR